MSVIRMKKETTESIGNKNVTRGKKKKKRKKEENNDRKSIEQWTKTKTDLENCKMKQTGGMSLVTISVIS